MTQKEEIAERNERNRRIEKHYWKKYNFNQSLPIGFEELALELLQKK